MKLFVPPPLIRGNIPWKYYSNLATILPAPARSRLNQVTTAPFSSSPTPFSRMKTLGLLGGMTYHATTIYYSQINARVQSRLGGSHSASLILHSFDHAEMQELFLSGQWDAAAQKLIKAAENLQYCGAEGIVLCVNTGHKVADQIEKALEPRGLPLLHIIDFTGQAVKDKGLKKVGLLGTKFVMEGDFITGRLSERYGLDVLVPEKAQERNAMNDVIFGDLGRNIITDKTKSLFVDAAKDLIDRGAEGIILACTELRFVMNQESFHVPLFDTVDLHARGAADWALQEK